jgi:hypothetical protein
MKNPEMNKAKTAKGSLIILTTLVVRSSTTMLRIDGVRILVKRTRRTRDLQALNAVLPQRTVGGAGRCPVKSEEAEGRVKNETQISLKGNQTNKRTYR